MGIARVLILLFLLTGCVQSVQYTQTELELANKLDQCVTESMQTRMTVLEAYLTSVSATHQMEQCMEGGRELTMRLNSCIDVLLNEGCTSIPAEEL